MPKSAPTPAQRVEGSRPPITLSVGTLPLLCEPATGNAAKDCFRHGRWIVEVRQDDQYEVLEERAEVVGNVLAINLDVSDLPELMRHGFRWLAHSEWIPRPTDTASQIYFDYCPDQGFPIFRGTSR